MQVVGGALGCLTAVLRLLLLHACAIAHAVRGHVCLWTPFLPFPVLLLRIGCRCWAGRSLKGLPRKWSSSACCGQPPSCAAGWLPPRSAAMPWPSTCKRCCCAGSGGRRPQQLTGSGAAAGSATAGRRMAAGRMGSRPMQLRWPSMSCLETATVTLSPPTATDAPTSGRRTRPLGLQAGGSSMAGRRRRSGSDRGRGGQRMIISSHLTYASSTQPWCSGGLDLS